ncbi:hypothetical protein KBC79_03960 [Candidatus Woesebacteria bacterium]|nr:hypothetical protein [Candidatus Woesebacteria bacterium]
MSNEGQVSSTTYRPSRESLAHMKHLRDVLTDVRNDIPQVKGLAFFGSRTHGRERQDPNRPSDLDTVVFYDGSEYTESGKFEPFDANGNLTPDFIQKNEKHQTDKRLHAMLQAKIKVRFSELMKERGLPIDIYSDFNGRINGTVLLEDVSPQATDTAIQQLKMYVDAEQADTLIPVGVINSPAFRTASRFLLGVDNSLYHSRQYILDKLEEMEQNGEHGEKYFRGLMNCVRELQMGDEPENRSLPQTIKDARSFYMTSTTNPSAF